MAAIGLISDLRERLPEDVREEGGLGPLPAADKVGG